MATHQAPSSLGFSRQEHWSGLPFPSPTHACMLSHFSRVRLCLTLWTAADQAILSLGFSRQEYWSGLPFPSPGDLPDPGIKSRSPALQADSLPSEPLGKPAASVKSWLLPVSGWLKRKQDLCVVLQKPGESGHNPTALSLRGDSSLQSPFWVLSKAGLGEGGGLLWQWPPLLGLRVGEGG